ncbi:hypothetical protein [Porphyromonas gingivalis]|nr:hypothetical protein [Porphyromonas gingivalis]
MFAGREEPQNKAMLESIRMNLDDFAPAQKVLYTAWFPTVPSSP